MNTITLALSLAVALEHLYIMYLETIATRSRRTARVFGLSAEQQADPTITTLLKNQGVYNGLLALLIVVAVLTGSLLWTQMLSGYVILVAAYGALTSNPMILLKQGGLALLALASSFVP